jgi:hypothetical protein
MYICWEIIENIDWPVEILLFDMIFIIFIILRIMGGRLGWICQAPACMETTEQPLIPWQPTMQPQPSI